jgi:hypothetical protein
MTRLATQSMNVVANMRKMNLSSVLAMQPSVALTDVGTRDMGRFRR